MLDCAQAAALLQGWDKILVMSHASPDGDTLGSASALLRGLASLGKEVAFFCADPVPEKFAFLFEGLALGTFEPEHVMAVDVADKKLLGKTPLRSTLPGRSWPLTTTAPMCLSPGSAGWSRRLPPPRR